MRKSINQEVLEEMGISSFVDIDLYSLNEETLKALDIWVDQYNHLLPPGDGISSSMLLSLLLLEEMIDVSVPSMIEDMDDERRSNFEQVITSIEQDKDQFSDFTAQEVTSSIILSSFVTKNNQLDRIKQLSITSQFEENELDQYTNNLEEIMGEDNLKQINQVLDEHPDSLEEQLQSLVENLRLTDTFGTIILKTIDLIKEQTKFRGGGPGEVQFPSYDEFYPEAYTQDKDWMPKVVLLAKHIKVWMHQLSRKYNTTIRTLDKIPDEELQEIVDRGFTGLWLIGIWERSQASKIIKERMGNSDAAASAYSLWDYVIADDLGGHQAYYSLSERAGKIGLRLASDMVPNHTGILSKWVIEHPDWFIQTSDPPFPSYQFMSEDLSDHPHVNIYLEDHYYSHSDAAVVFKRVDTENNNVRYIYHGNDGTSIPWNDTAQLDFLKEEVRHHVINTILHVAKLFPIIRLDAAMVLTKKHFHRLWYPAPGTGGDIPSRSRYGLSHEQFDKLFPIEFWREVVDRIEQEAPDTLLVAEAFWMLEGYFVRTLGVHRVYNSAFMHMLRDQKNEEYRGLIKSTLTYDPRILQRYVNFMSNPDEDTAIEQFGNSDKYFGVTVMMVTLPGMPMFGHGQIEGYHEKYGMEFTRDYWQESVDDNLVELHQDLIFPLIRKRYLFAQVKYFRLYDVYHPDGWVIEDIYSHSNKVNDEFTLVFYNNSIDTHSGWIKQSLPFNAQILDINQSDHFQSSLYQELHSLPNSDTAEYCLFKNYYGDQYYFQSLSDIENRGLFIELKGYQFKIFSDFLLLSSDDVSDEFIQSNQGGIKGSELPKSIQSILDR